MKKKYRYKKIGIYDWAINFLSIICAIIIIFAVVNKILSRQIKISVKEKNVCAFEMPIKNFLKLQALSQKYNLPFSELITIYSLENNFFPDKSAIENENEIEQNLIINYSQIKKKYNHHLLNQYSSMFKNILAEIKYFPIAADVCSENDLPYIYGDNCEQNFDNKIPPGCNIFDRENISGRIPIVSMTDGTIENINWNDSLGYNISVKTENDDRYLYCHLEKFAQDLEQNKKISAGQLLGYMGNTKKESEHKFVHLHLCINPKVNFAGKDFYINPYLFLRLIESQKVTLKK